MTITQTVEVPASHRANGVGETIDVPREVPAGTTARFEIHWFPQTEAVNNLDALLKEIRFLCKDAPVTVDSFLEMRRQDRDLEEKQFRQFFPDAGGGV